MVRRDISPARPGQRDPTFRNMGLLLLLTLSGLLLVQSAQDLSYFDDGLDWGGTCVTSKQQSPINLVSTQYTPASSASPSAFTFGTGTNVTVCSILFKMHLHACASRCICAASVARNHVLRLYVAMQQHNVQIVSMLTGQRLVHWLVNTAETYIFKQLSIVLNKFC